MSKKGSLVIHVSECYHLLSASEASSSLKGKCGLSELLPSPHQLVTLTSLIRGPLEFYGNDGASGMFMRT